ncbi:MAG: acyl carrier protein [Desulfobacteraceae bacterium]|nr:acyl carrier protein [Desulfobacteraceae bacterium]
MEKMSTEKIIREFIIGKLLSDQKDLVFSDKDSLIDSGIIDSFGIMALMGFVEEEFTIKVAGDDLLPENFDSIITISAMIGEIINRQPEV